MDKRVGFVGIIIDHREKAADKVNKIISEYGSSIVARQGVPYEKKGCSVITLVVDMTSDELGALTGKLGVLENVSVKSALAKA
ncbi:MAG: TM1266 family iron-only hydrogenase system putative regulator [Candidatus Omnitrophota bacterium]